LTRPLFGLKGGDEGAIAFSAQILQSLELLQDDRWGPVA
jgi:hypothetical protein